MTEQFFVIRSSEDGFSVDAMTEGELVSRLIVEDGSNYYGTNGFFSSFPDDQPAYWDERKLLIIRGQIITPKPVQQVTKWEIS